MRKLFFLLLLIVIALGAMTTIRHKFFQIDPKNQITISGAWALYPLTIKWAEEFHKLSQE